jgi:uncharacterized membrane protein
MQNPLNTLSNTNGYSADTPASQGITNHQSSARMVTTVFALIGSLIALYLFLVDIGASPLICPTSGCEVVQASAFSKIFGIPTALYGLAIFLTLLGSSIAGLFVNFIGKIPIQVVLIVLSSISMLFYLYLTYLEAFVILAWCLWCVGSSIMMLGVWITALWGARNPRPVMASA